MIVSSLKNDLTKIFPGLGIMPLGAASGVGHASIYHNSGGLTFHSDLRIFNERPDFSNNELDLTMVGTSGPSAGRSTGE